MGGEKEKGGAEADVESAERDAAVFFSSSSPSLRTTSRVFLSNTQPRTPPHHTPPHTMGKVQEVAKGVSKAGRSKTYHRRGLFAIKKKHGGKFPTHPKQAKKEAAAEKVGV